VNTHLVKIYSVEVIVVIYLQQIIGQLDGVNEVVPAKQYMASVNIKKLGCTYFTSMAAAGASSR
jgi:hypothetical protein